MAKIGSQKQQDEKMEALVKPTREQVKKFEKVLYKYKSKQEFLVARGCIRAYESTWSIMYYEGMIGTADPISGVPFNSNFPLELYEMMIEEVNKLDRQREYAKNKQVENYSQLEF